MGANGAALGLLCAWLVDDRLAARRGDDQENDMLGVYVIAAVLVRPLAHHPGERTSPPPWAVPLAGSVFGLLLPRLTRRS